MSGVLIEAGGWALLHFLWQGAVIAALLGLFLAMVRKRSQVRYLAGCVALLAMVGVVTSTFIHQYRSLAAAAELKTTPTAEPPTVLQTVIAFEQCRPCHLVEPVDEDPQMVASPDIGQSSGLSGHGDPVPSATPPGALLEVSVIDEPMSSRAILAISWLVTAWLSGVILLSLRLAVACGTARRILRRGTSAVEAALAMSLQQVAERLGVIRPVRLLRSTRLVVPTVVGWWSPVILLPVASLAGLSRSQLEAVLAHELAHIRRHDYFVNLLQHGLETVLFFHPAVWWVSRKVREEREHCCDDIAATASGGALGYARALAALEEHRGDRIVLGVAADGGSLLARIRRLNGADHPRCGLLILVSALLLLAAIAVPLAMLPQGNDGGEKRIGGELPAKVARVRPLPSEQAVKGLRHLLAKEPETGIPYEDFLRLTKGLDDEALLKLIEEIGLKGGDGYTAWTRSALFTEWGRRDFDAAVAYITQYRKPLSRGQSVLHAVFHGARPEDPEQALIFLNRLHGDERFRMKNTGRYDSAHAGADWVRVAYRRLLEELTTRDPERAWNLLPRNGGMEWNWNKGDRSWGSQTPELALYRGFFAGQPDAKSTARYVERLGSVGDMLAISIAAGWMEHDLQAAVAWAPPQRVSQNGESVMIGGAVGNALNYWARDNPEQALQAIRENALPEIRSHSDVAGQLLRGNSHLATELAEILTTHPASRDGHSQAWYPLHNAMYELGKMKDEDRFPEAGQRNQPPDYEARYESFRLALQHPGLPDEDRASLQQRLDQVFYNKLMPVTPAKAAE